MSVATSVGGPAGVERVHVAGAGALAQVAVELDRRDAVAVELAGERLGAVLGAGEDHGAAGCAGQVDQDRQPVRRGRCAGRGGPSWRSATAPSRPVGHRRLRNRLTRTSIALSRVAENSSRWPSRGVLSSRRRTDGKEAEVGHVVGLVEDGDLDVEPSEQWPWPIRSSSRPGQATTMSTPRRRACDLGVLADAAEDGAGAEAGCLGQRRERGVDLADQLTGRRQDQRAGCARGARLAARAVEPGDEREQERVGLAGAGAAAAEHVAPGKASRAAWLPGSGWGWRCRGRRGRRARFAGTPRSVKEGVKTRRKSLSLGVSHQCRPPPAAEWEAVPRTDGEGRVVRAEPEARLDGSLAPT